MNFTTKMVSVFVLVIAIVLLGVFFAGKDTSVNNYDEFAKCLTSKGMKMYGAFWCSHCQEQKKEFGNSFQYVIYVECSTPDGKSQMSECTSAGIQSYPSWILPNGKVQAGKLSFQELAALSGCKLPA